MTNPGIVTTTSTPQRLRRLRVGIVSALVLALVGAVSTFLVAHSAAVSVQSAVVPAQAAIADTWNLLHRVDVALSTCTTDPAAQRGRTDCAVVLANGEYHGQIAIAVQNLAVLAGLAVGDRADRQVIQVVQGLLIDHLGLVEQAHFHLGQGHALLAEAYLRYAGNLLRGSIHDQLLDFVGRIGAELARQRQTHDNAPALALLWLVPLLVAVGLLLGGQVWLTKRFNRWLNVPLATASVGLVALGVVAARPLWAGAALAESTDGVRALLDAGLPPSAPALGPDDHLVAVAATAARSFNLEYVMPVLAIVCLALVIVGFQRRLDEYGTRSG
ncbi:hypothetical protein [Luedemannella flava]|uniref:hypothetical protein n=1 Tax=Luedemannella flava TaxID=349316 RepID=UPI0031DDE9AA